MTIGVSNAGAWGTSSTKSFELSSIALSLSSPRVVNRDDLKRSEEADKAGKRIVALRRTLPSEPVEEKKEAAL